MEQEGEREYEFHLGRAAGTWQVVGDLECLSRLLIKSDVAVLICQVWQLRCLGERLSLDVKGFAVVIFSEVFAQWFFGRELLEVLSIISAVFFAVPIIENI